VRPVDKGPAPQVFTDYADARDPLIARIGDYCSYCERPCDPYVEHIEPQSKYPHRASDWDNFLLGCMYCNTVKKDTYTGPNAYHFPDEKNTAYLFVYDEASNEVLTNPAITDPAMIIIGENTRELVGLNRRLDSRGRPDRRWLKRLGAWSIANRAHTRHYANLPIDAKDIESIRELAVSTGFFSIWLTAFADVPDVRVDLIRTFPNTREACYELATGEPTPDLDV
jgi:hypothetical protein